jgi:hypothetical protein
MEIVMFVYISFALMVWAGIANYPLFRSGHQVLGVMGTLVYMAVLYTLRTHFWWRGGFPKPDGSISFTISEDETPTFPQVNLYILIEVLYFLILAMCTGMKFTSLTSCS